MSEKTMSALNEASEHLDQALDHHAAGRHASVKRRVELARACIQRATEAQSVANANPTADTGAQVSNGQSPRDYSPEAIRARDQRAAIDAAYRRRMAEGARR